MVDLKKAYLQVQVAPELWVYQAVRWKGQTYLLTRLGFGLNVAPKVMTAVVERVLAQDTIIQRATSSYIDDVLVDERVAPAEDVVQHLEKFGLHAKQPEKLGCAEGVRVLGLRVDQNGSWARDSPLSAIVEAVQQGITRRQVHSLVGEWLGHFPVGGWLRAAGGYLQRCTAKDGGGWDEPVSEHVLRIVDDVVRRLTVDDPVRGQWAVNEEGAAVLWVDASNLAIGVAMEVDGEIIEDAAWLRSAEDVTHINLSELEAAVRGINLALKWGFRRFVLKTDSATVKGWLTAVFERTHNVRTRAMSELLIK